MATLNVIYKIAADISGLQSGVNRAASAMESLDSKAVAVGRSLAGMVSVGTIIAFGKTVLDAADDIQKMADQTGMATEEVQRLQYISGQTSTSVESLVSAAQNLQQRLGENNSGTIGAIAKLNLNLEAFTKLGAYQQMTTLADRVRAIKDPTDQAAIAADLFGKNWKEILPAIKAGMEQVGDQAVVMSDKTIQSLDRIGDTLERAKSTATAWGGSLVLAIEGAGYAFGQFLSKFDPAHLGLTNDELIRMQGALNDPSGLQGALQNATNAAGKLTQDGIAPLGKVIAPTGSALAALTRQWDTDREAMNKASAAAAKAADELKRLQVEITALNRASAQPLFTPEGYDPTKGEIPGLAKLKADLASMPFAGLNAELGKTGAIVNALASTSLPQLSVGFAAAASAAGNLAGRAQSLGQILKTNLLGVLKSIPQTIANAFTGGGNLLGAFQSIGSQLGSAIGDGIGKTISALGSLGGPIGSAIGSLVGPLIGWIGKLFSSPEKQINPIRQAFVDAAGGLATLNQRAHEAGVTLDHLLDARTPEAYKKAIEELNAAFEFQDDAMRTLDETVKKYGFTLEELGPAMIRQNLDKQAQELYKDFRVLTGAGIDVDTVLGRMGDSINDFVHNALKTGTEIPAAMAPLLQRMVELGQLTDENGNVITDLEAAGVRFAMTMSEGFQALIGEVQKLTEAIARGLGLAIENIPDPEVTGHVTWTIDDIPNVDDLDRQFQVPAMADGGIVTRPTLALIGESGPEAVIPLSGRSGGAGATVTIQNLNVQVSEGDDPKRVADKVIDALRTQTPLYDAIGTIAQRKVAA